MATHRRVGIRLAGEQTTTFFDTAPHGNFRGRRHASDLRDHESGKLAMRVDVDQFEGKWRVRIFCTAGESGVVEHGADVDGYCLARFHNQTGMRLRVSQIDDDQFRPKSGVLLFDVESVKWKRIARPDLFPPGDDLERLVIVAVNSRVLNLSERQSEAREERP